VWSVVPFVVESSDVVFPAAAVYHSVPAVAASVAGLPSVRAFAADGVSPVVVVWHSPKSVAITDQSNEFH